MAALGQRRALGVADDVDLLVGLRHEARQLDRRPALAETGLADECRRAHRQHQVGLGERHVAHRGGEPPAADVDRAEVGAGQVLELGGVAAHRCHQRLGGRRRHRVGIGVDDDDLALDAAPAHLLGDQAGALVGRRRAAVGRLGYADDEAAAVGEEALDLRAHRALLEGAKAHRQLRARLGVAADGLVHVLDAGRQHQEVVGQPSAGRDDGTAGTVDGGGALAHAADAHRVDRGVVALEVGRRLEAGDVVRAQRAGHEGVVGFHQRHLHLAAARQRARSAQATPAAAQHHDPRLGCGRRAAGHQRCRGGQAGVHHGAPGNRRSCHRGVSLEGRESRCPRPNVTWPAAGLPGSL